MAEHFLTKTRIDLTRCIKIGGSAAIEQYDALTAFLAATAGEDVAKLFAEPLLSKGNDQAASTVSWYSDRAGQGVPLARLDAAAQESVGAVLSARLNLLKPLIDEDDTGLLAAALYIGGPGDIWSVEGQPVLVNWGLAPEAGADLASRTAHYANTLGPFLPLDAPPALTGPERDRSRSSTAVPVATAAAAAATTAGAAVNAATTTEPESTARPQPVSAPANPSARSETPRGRVPLVAWLPMLLLLVLFGGVLAWLLVPGNRIFADDGPQPVIADEDALRTARAVNRALEQRLAELDSALAGAVCRADGTLLMPDGLTIEGLLPPDMERGPAQGGEVIRADTTPVLPPAPDRVIVPPVGGDITDTASLLEHIDARTAMVLVGTAQGMAGGTGFFVSPDLMITNYHVIEGATPEAIFATNKSMGGLRRAEVLKTFGPMRDVGGDFALLRVEGAAQPFYAIRQSDASMRLQSVIAAGYPGDVLNTDSQFRALQGGDVSAVPALTVTDGSVNTEQSLSDTSSAVVHSAPISTGNSGGPLIDLCGRVVGVNTFVVQGPLRNLNVALSTDDLLSFLAGTDAAPEVTAAACEPLVARPSPVPVAAGQ